MTSLARPIGLGLAARDDIGDVVGWAREARDAGLDSIWIHDSYFERDAITFATAIARAFELDGRYRRGWLPGRPRRGQPEHPPSGRPGHDRLGPRRDPAGPDRHGPGHGPAAAPQADGHPLRARRRPRGRVDGDRPDAPPVARRAPALGDARPAADPADVRADPPDPDPHRRLPARVRDPGRAEGRRLPGPAGRVDPVAAGHPRAARRGGDRGRPRSGRDRDARATSCRSSTRPGARRSTGRSASRS